MQSEAERKATPPADRDSRVLLGLPEGNDSSIRATPVAPGALPRLLHSQERATGSEIHHGGGPMRIVRWFREWRAWVRAQEEAREEKLRREVIGHIEDHVCEGTHIRFTTENIIRDVRASDRKGVLPR